jgi:hypothetical protein
MMMPMIINLTEGDNHTAPIAGVDNTHTVNNYEDNDQNATEHDGDFPVTMGAPPMSTPATMKMMMRITDSW